MLNNVAPGAKYEATAWVSVANIAWNGIDGTVKVNSDTISLDYGSLPEDIADVMIETRFSHQRTGGAGDVRTYLWLPDGALASFVGDGVSFGTATNYTGVIAARATIMDRRVFVKPLIIQSRGAWNHNNINVLVRAYGTEAGTEWAVTNIQGRLIYLPF